MTKILAQPEIRQRLLRLGFEPTSGGGGARPTYEKRGEEAQDGGR